MSENEEYSSGDEEPYTFYRDRPEWKDITPIPQKDGEVPVVKIAYTEAFEDVYDYFRAVVQKGELSERALLLTQEAIQMNAANYTVWQYRRKILKHLDINLKWELDYCRSMIEQNPKNYQVWHHRRVVVEWLGDPSRELRLTQIIFSMDSKNYHAWEHRQWVLRTYNLFDGELDYVTELLEEDIRNNSAWNQRYFVITNTTGFTDDVIAKEIDYTKSAINKLVSNESPWSYLRGILIHSSMRLSEHDELVSWCESLQGGKGKNCPHLLTFIIDILEDQMEVDAQNRTSLLQRALEYCENLANHYDKIRKEYWMYFARRLSFKFSNDLQNNSEATES